MKRLLRLTRFPYEEPYHINLLIEVSNGRQRASIEYYTNAEDLPELGRALSDFPFAGVNEHIYEIGSEDPEDRFAYHIRLRFYLIQAIGHTGIEIRFNNNKTDSPEREFSEFTVETDVAGINRLGKLLVDFGHLNHDVLEWDGIDGHLT